ncbi:MAG: hypothetical protein RL292_555 [Candidatus Parcubacteria bacterium]|jgi:hypothetical protein
MEEAPDINPTSPEEEIPQPEAAPQTYEEMLGAAKALRLQGVDPFEYADYSESGNPELIRLRDNLQDWESKHNLAMKGIESVEKAEATVQAAMFWIEAGYTDEDTIIEAIDRLTGEQNELTEDVQPEIRKIIISAAKNVGEMRKPEAVIERALAKAYEYIENENFQDAVPLLHELINNKTYATYFTKNPLKKPFLTELRDNTRAKLWAQKGFTKK